MLKDVENKNFTLDDVIDKIKPTELLIDDDGIKYLQCNFCRKVMIDSSIVLENNKAKCKHCKEIIKLKG